MKSLSLNFKSISTLKQNKNFFHSKTIIVTTRSAKNCIKENMSINSCGVKKQNKLRRKSATSNIYYFHLHKSQLSIRVKYEQYS